MYWLEVESPDFDLDMIELPREVEPGLPTQNGLIYVERVYDDDGRIVKSGVVPPDEEGFVETEYGLSEVKAFWPVWI